ncbi:MAG: alpha-1,2-fucosyltransferase [Chlamydiales bacterium]|nr:alpha-1,2-fucosyltransferase [Chlamydiales bacterium]
MGIHSTTDDSFVTCDIRGAIGNQIFEIATTLAYAWEYDAIPVFPDLNRTDSHISINRDLFFFRLDPSSSSVPFTASYQEHAWHSSEKIPYQKNCKLFGYFQSWKRFHPYRDELLKIFAPSEKITSSLEKKYSALLRYPKTVSLHVRTFSPELHASKIHPFLGLEYYRKALSLFPDEQTLFVVFSDRINWCKKHLPSLKRAFLFIEDNNPIEDLFLMAKMKHHIIANSSYSWWGAYLNQNPEKIVVAPISWMHPDYYPFPLVQPNDLLLPDWILVSPDFSESYPEDMTHYDITKSLD